MICNIMDSWSCGSCAPGRLQRVAVRFKRNGCWPGPHARRHRRQASRRAAVDAQVVSPQGCWNRRQWAPARPKQTLNLKMVVEMDDEQDKGGEEGEKGEEDEEEDDAQHHHRHEQRHLPRSDGSSCSQYGSQSAGSGVSTVSAIPCRADQVMVSACCDLKCLPARLWHPSTPCVQGDKCFETSRQVFCTGLMQSMIETRVVGSVRHDCQRLLQLPASHSREKHNNDPNPGRSKTWPFDSSGF